MKLPYVLFLLLSLGGCAGYKPYPETVKVVPDAIAAQPEAKAQAPASAAPAAHGAAGAHGSADAHAVPEGVAPDQALQWLKNGNNRFVKGQVRKDGQSNEDRIRLSTGQKPHTIVLSCSDSRVPPELVFDQKLGELFVVRTAGQTLSASAIASIEYAIAHLGSRLIVVMGHSACGAVKAAIGTLSGGDAGSANLNDLVRDIHPRIAQFRGTAASPDVESESWANARGVAQDLVARSSLLKDATLRGSIKITSALYHLKNGEVSFE